MPRNTNDKLQVLFISSWYPNKLEPRNGNFVQRHAEAVATKHNVEVLHAIGDPEQKESFVVDDQIINGIRTIVVYYKKSPSSAINFMRRQKAYKLGYDLLSTPDIVHANVLRSNILLAVRLWKRLRTPFVVSEHNTIYRTINRKQLNLFSKFIAKYIGNKAAHIMPVSKELKEGLKNIGIQTPQQIVPNVVDTDLFKIKDDTEKHTPFRFLHISNLQAIKQADKILTTALQLMDKGYDIQLAIGGDGDIKPLEEILSRSEHADRVEIFGALNSNEVAEKMRYSDAFILFSTDENQPCVINESFSSGTHVISTDVGGVREFFMPGFGEILTESNEDYLAQSMIELMENNKLQPSTRLHQYAEKEFSKESIAAKFDKIYTTVLN